MRPFSEFILEFLGMAVPGLNGLLTKEWNHFEELKGDKKPTTKKQLLAIWDEATQQINEIFPKIPASRFSEVDTAFGQWEGTGRYFLFYFIDNEIHHRGQAYVYLRALGIEPPGFWER
jgi:uncharacterized damage-inducible protein DinB